MPLLGLLVAVLLLPFATARWVPTDARPALSYLVVWVPFVVAIVLSCVRAVRGTEAAWWRALDLRLAGWGVIVGLFVGLLVRSAAFVLELVGTGRLAGGEVAIDGGSPGVAELVGLLVASILIGPIVEEGLFRGVLQPALIERLGSGRPAVWVGVALTAALFALVHAIAGSGLLSAVITFVAGLGLGVVARANGLVASTVAHATFNATGVVLLLVNTPRSPLRPTLGLG